MKIEPTFKNEAHFQRSVERAAQALGWRVWHCKDARGSRRGFPDLAMAKPGHRILFFELKTGRRKLTIEQRAWIDDLNRCPGARAFEVRPEQWDWVLQILQEAPVTGDGQ